MEIKSSIMKEIELTEKEEGELQRAATLIDTLYNIVSGVDAEELIVEMDGVNAGNIPKEELYEIGETLEKILFADVLYTKTEEE